MAQRVGSSNNLSLERDSESSGRDSGVSSSSGLSPFPRVTPSLCVTPCVTPFFALPESPTLQGLQEKVAQLFARVKRCEDPTFMMDLADYFKLREAMDDINASARLSPQLKEEEKRQIQILNGVIPYLKLFGHFGELCKAGEISPKISPKGKILDPSVRRMRAIVRDFLNGGDPVCMDKSICIGTGTQGGVRTCSILGEPCVQKIPKVLWLNENSGEDPESESTNCLRCSANSHILPICGAYSSPDSDRPILFFPYLDGGTFEDALTSETLTPKEVIDSFYYIADALNFIHCMGRVHRDLKPSNILMRNKKPMLIDLGLMTTAQQMAAHPTKTLGTCLYLPPEAFNGKIEEKTAPQVDVWAFGICLWRLLYDEKNFSHPCWPGRFDPSGSFTPGAFMYRMGNPRNDFTQEANLRAQLDEDKVNKYDREGHLIRLMVKCLARDPAKRPTMGQVLQELAQNFDLVKRKVKGRNKLVHRQTQTSPQK